MSRQVIKESKIPEWAKAQQHPARSQAAVLACSMACIEIPVTDVCLPGHSNGLEAPSWACGRRGFVRKKVDLVVVLRD